MNSDSDKSALDDDPSTIFPSVVEQNSSLFGIGDAKSLSSLIKEQDEMLEAYQQNEKEIVANERAQRLKLEK